MSAMITNIRFAQQYVFFSGYLNSLDIVAFVCLMQFGNLLFMISEGSSMSQWKAAGTAAGTFRFVQKKYCKQKKKNSNGING